MTTGDRPPEVSEVSTSDRFEARIDGSVAGFVDYERRDDRVVFTHTEVDPSFEGRGVGGALAKTALDQVRDHGERVVPLCEFIAAYIDRHAAYADLVDHQLWDELRDR